MGPKINIGYRNRAPKVGGSAYLGYEADMGVTNIRSYEWDVPTADFHPHGMEMSHIDVLCMNGRSPMVS